MVEITCVAVPPLFFYCRKSHGKQLEPPLPPSFSSTTFHYSALLYELRNFSLIPNLARQMWAPWCTPLSLPKRQQFLCRSSSRTSALKLENGVPGACECGFLYCSHFFFSAVEREEKGKQQCAVCTLSGWCALTCASRNMPHESISLPLLTHTTRSALALLLL